VDAKNQNRWFIILFRSWRFGHANGNVLHLRQETGSTIIRLFMVFGEFVSFVLQGLSTPLAKLIGGSTRQ